jgi:tetratricopeptide (TPR) repeat protein
VIKSAHVLKALCLVGLLATLSSCQSVESVDPSDASVEPIEDTAEAVADKAPAADTAPSEAPSKADGHDGNRLFDEGVEAYQDDQLEIAAEKIEAALEAGITDYDLDQAYTILGNVYTDLDEFEKAIEQHKAALQINPNNHQAWVNMGVAYRLVGDYDAAETAYLKALDLAPDYPELYASLGALSVVKGEPEQAIEHLEHAAKLDSNIPVTFANLALAYAMVDRFDEAETSLKRAIALGYKNGDVVKARIQEFRAAAQ